MKSTGRILIFSFFRLSGDQEENWVEQVCLPQITEKLKTQLGKIGKILHQRVKGFRANRGGGV